MSEQENNQATDSSRSNQVQAPMPSGAPRPDGGNLEWIKFGAFTVVLIVVIGGVWLLGPAAFEWIAPAILGDGSNSRPAVVMPTPAVPPEETGAESEGEIEIDGEIEVDEDVTPAEAEAANEAEGDASNESPTDAYPSPTEQSGSETAVTHVVKRGETLTAIAAQYNLTINDILAANNIPNPNRIEAGTELMIPTP